MFGGFAFSCEAKSASTSKAPSPHILSATSALSNIQLRWLECSVASLFPRQRAPLRQKLHPPHILSKPPPLLSNIQLRWLECSVASLFLRGKERLYVKSSIPSLWSKPPPLLSNIQWLECSVASLFLRGKERLYVKSSIPLTF